MSSVFKRDENNRFVATKNFSMPKAVKRRLATIVNSDQRGHWKSCMMQAVMQSFEVIEKKKKNPVTGKLEVVTE